MGQGTTEYLEEYKPPLFEGGDGIRETGRAIVQGIPHKRTGTCLPNPRSPSVRYNSDSPPFTLPNSKYLLGPIKLRPLSFLSTEIPVDRPWLEWQRLRVEQEVLSMASNVIDVHTKKVDGWFPSPS
jgi:hypothetical protein